MSARGKTLYFTTASTLPPDSVCQAIIADGVLLDDGTDVDPNSWTFETGTGSRMEWRFTEPRTLTDIPSQIFETLYVEDKLILVHLTGPSLYVSVSTDNGETIQRSNPINVTAVPFGSLITDLGAAYKAGVLYLSWRVLPPGTPFSDNFFSRSTNSDLMSYSIPVLIPPIHPLSVSFSPSFAVDDNNRIYLSWYERCAFGTPPQCPFQIEGIYLAAVSSDGQIEQVEQLTDWNSSGPRLAFVANNLFVIWGRDPVPDDPGLLQYLEIHNYNAGMIKLAQLGKLEGIAVPYRLDRLPGERAIVTWTEKDPLAGLHTHYAARLDGLSQSVSSLETLVQVSGRSPENRCTRLNVSEQGKVAILMGFAASILSDAYRGIHLSNDEGRTFSTTIWMEDMGAIYRENKEGDITDDLCPSFEQTDTGYIHAAWPRVTYENGDWHHTLVNSRASRVAPCSKPSWNSDSLP